MNILQLFGFEWPWWTMWAIYGGAALLALIALGAVKQIAGWPGVMAVLLAVASIASAVVGFKQGVEWADKHHSRGKPKDSPFTDIFGGLFGRK